VLFLGTSFNYTRYFIKRRKRLAVKHYGALSIDESSPIVRLYLALKNMIRLTSFFAEEFTFLAR
jgi:hypothetical protein